MLALLARSLDHVLVCSLARVLDRSLTCRLARSLSLPLPCVLSPRRSSPLVRELGGYGRVISSVSDARAFSTPPLREVSYLCAWRFRIQHDQRGKLSTCVVYSSTNTKSSVIRMI